MVEEICRFLKARRPNATDDWCEKLHAMSKHFEDALYHEANSLEEFCEHATLKVRMLQLALSMGGKNK
jgi:hypothetical protein